MKGPSDGRGPAEWQRRSKGKPARLEKEWEQRRHDTPWSQETSTQARLRRKLAQVRKEFAALGEDTSRGGEMADASDSKSEGLTTREGSNPSLGTTTCENCRQMILHTHDDAQELPLAEVVFTSSRGRSGEIFRRTPTEEEKQVIAERAALARAWQAERAALTKPRISFGDST